MADRMPTAVELMAEHADDFLWNRSPDRAPGDDYVVDPAALGVSPALIERLDAWNLEWSRRALGLGATDGRASATAWREDGLRLAVQLQKEFDALGLGVDVLYAHDDDPRPVRARRGR